MRRLAILFVLLAPGMTGCHRTPNSDWPESGRKQLWQSCHDANVKSGGDWLCDCMYAPDGLPARVSWHEYQDWRGADVAHKDPKITHKTAELNATCTAAHAKAR